MVKLGEGSSSTPKTAWRISFFGDEVEEIAEFDPLTGKTGVKLNSVRVHVIAAEPDRVTVSAETDWVTSLSTYPTVQQLTTRAISGPAPQEPTDTFATQQAACSCRPQTCPVLALRGPF